MILDKVLILKGLGGLTALGGTAAAAYFGITSLGGDSPESLIENAGFKCTFNGDSCEITTLESGKKINVKNNTTKEEGKTFTVSASGPKIKVQKNFTEGGYNQNLKLTIEGGDITLTNGTTSGSNSITKLEQFETYEIVKEGDKWYLTRKNDALTGKSKALGLPDNCKLPSSETTTCENITQEQLKAIKFDGKQENQDITVNGTVTLTITKVESSDSIFGTGGYKFAFATNKDITISSTPANKIMKNTNTEFKIKETTATGSTAKTLSLEKAWTADSLAKKAGLTGCDTTNKECTLPTSETLKLYISDSDKIENGKVTESKKIKYEENVEGHNQGFKFYIDSSGQEISLTSGSETKKIEKDNATYEIKEHTENSQTKWYLTKHTANAS